MKSFLMGIATLWRMRAWVVLALLLSAAGAEAAGNPNNDMLINVGSGQDSGIQRVYYYGSTTVLEFSNYPMYFSVEDEQGNQITNFKRDGKFARIPGRREFLQASIDGTQVTLKAIPQDKPLIRKARTTMPGLDFAYELTGDPEAMPLQIFDDGKKTFFQFKKDADSPITFTEISGKAVLLALKSDQGTTARIFEGLQPSFQFVLGQYTATARYTGKQTRKPQELVTLITEDKSGQQARIEQIRSSAVSSDGQGGVKLAAALPSPASTKVATIDVATSPAVQSWTLTGGHTVYQDLKVWAEKAGWKVIWNLAKDWTVPANTAYSGEFSQAAGDVIKTLAANGALIRVQFYEGNKTMVVSGHGVTAQ